MQPLQGLRVLDFSQFLAGPACGLRLADLGAEVIKIERPKTGDICRKLYIAKQKIGDDSTLFHAINRNKKSIALDLKSPKDEPLLLDLIQSADIVIQNFRPGVAKRLGIDYKSLQKIKPDLIYGSVSGYGSHHTPWKDKPGQDLLAQSLSAITQQNNDHSSLLVFGLPIADLSAAYNLTQGILALLVRKGTTGQGGEVEVSLLESLIDLQAEKLTHIKGSLPAFFPYDLSAQLSGIYETKDGQYITLLCKNYQKIAMIFDLKESELSAKKLASIIIQYDLLSLMKYVDNVDIFIEPVLDWHQLLKSDHYQSLKFEQKVQTASGETLLTTRCPIQIDGQKFYSSIGAPSIGQNNDEINK